MAHGRQGYQGEEGGAVRVALAQQLGGIGSVKLGELPDPVPGTGQALVRVHGAGAGPWDVGFLSGGVFDYHAAGWAGQVRAASGGGADLLLDCAGGQTRDQAIGAVRDGGRVISIVLQGPPVRLERGITGESFAAHGGRARLEALSRLVGTGALRPQVAAVLPLNQAREALARVAGRHTRGKIVLQTGQ